MSTQKNLKKQIEDQICKTSSGAIIKKPPLAKDLLFYDYLLIIVCTFKIENYFNKVNPKCQCRIQVIPKYKYKII